MAAQELVLKATSRWHNILGLTQPAESRALHRVERFAGEQGYRSKEIRKSIKSSPSRMALRTEWRYNFTAVVHNADPETKKRVARALFDSVIIHPKDKESGDRLFEVKGVCLPLTRNFLVTPTGLEGVVRQIRLMTNKDK